MSLLVLIGYLLFFFCGLLVYIFVFPPTYLLATSLRLLFLTRQYRLMDLTIMAVPNRATSELRGLYRDSAWVDTFITLFSFLQNLHFLCVFWSAMYTASQFYKPFQQRGNPTG